MARIDCYSCKCETIELCTEDEEGGWSKQGGDDHQQREHNTAKPAGAKEKLSFHSINVSQRVDSLAEQKLIFSFWVIEH